MLKYITALALLFLAACQTDKEPLTGVAAEHEGFTGTINGQQIAIQPARSSQSQNPCFINDTNGDGVFGSQDERSYQLSSVLNTGNQAIVVNIGTLYLPGNTNVNSAFANYLKSSHTYAYGGFDNFCVFNNGESTYTVKVDYFDQFNGQQYSSYVNNGTIFDDQTGSSFTITDAYLFSFEGQRLLRIKALINCKLYTFWGDMIQMNNAVFIGSFSMPNV